MDFHRRINVNKIRYESSHRIHLHPRESRPVFIRRTKHSNGKDRIQGNRRTDLARGIRQIIASCFDVGGPRSQWKGTEGEGPRPPLPSSGQDVAADSAALRRSFHYGPTLRLRNSTMKGSRKAKLTGSNRLAPTPVFSRPTRTDDLKAAHNRIYIGETPGPKPTKYFIVVHFPEVG